MAEEAEAKKKADERRGRGGGGGRRKEDAIERGINEETRCCSIGRSEIATYCGKSHMFAQDAPLFPRHSAT